MSVSLWQRTPRSGGHACDVAVVGAGISGLSAAIELARQGVDALVLEARAPGAGASGRNAGFLMRGAADNYAAAVRDWGRDRARTVWRWTEDNLKDLVALGVDEVPTFERRPSCLVALEGVEAEELRRSAALMVEDGFDAPLLGPGEGPDDPLWRSGRPVVGLLNPSDAVCNPAHLVAHLRSLVEPARLLTGAEVGGIAPDGDGLRLETSLGPVEARRVLVCTNAWAANLLPALSGLITPNRGQMLAVRPDRPEDAALACAYYLDHGSEYIRRGPPGTIVFGGARKHHVHDERIASEEPSAPVQAHLERMLRELITPKYEVVARWAGVMGFSKDDLPLAGPLPVKGVADGAVWVCAGFTGHGMSMACRTSTATVRHMLGGAPTPFNPARLLPA